MEHINNNDSYDEEPIEIPLHNKGLITWISPEDADIAEWGWRAKQAGSKVNPKWYAVHSYTISGITTEIYLQDLIWERMMGHPTPPNLLVDHINQDKLDNRRSNLRLATSTQNEANKPKRQGNVSSKYKGVIKMKGRKKCWRAIITKNSMRRELGCYYTEEEAALAYNKAALEEFGQFAFLNDVEGEPPEIKASEWKDDARPGKGYGRRGPPRKAR